MNARRIITSALRPVVRGKLAHRRELAAAGKRRYADAPELAMERRDWQLAAFDRVWQRVQREVPYYRDAVKAGRLPTEVTDWESFVERFPIIDRKTVQAAGEALHSTARPPGFWRITGGSTAEPVKLPAWFSEREETELNEWYARSWWHVSPEDASFRIWGHAHRLGTGWRGLLRRQVRVWKDLALGIDRFSAYDLSEQRLNEAIRRYEAFKAPYVLGYSGALHRLAEQIARIQGRVNHAPRMVLATSESFPDTVARERTADIFRAPVVMEYGSEETGLLAQTDETGSYRVMWQSYFVELVEQGTLGYKVRVTSLYPRAFPLIRYELGDELVVGEPQLGAERFSEVAGRASEVLRLSDGTLLHPRVIMHAVKECPRVEAYQLVNRDGTLTLRLVPRGELTPKDLQGIRERLARISGGLEAVELQLCERLEQTRAGKTPAILNR